MSNKQDNLLTNVSLIILLENIKNSKCQIYTSGIHKYFTKMFKL